MPFVEEGMPEAGLRSGDGTGLVEFARGLEGGTTRGEAAMVASARAVSSRLYWTW